MKINYKGNILVDHSSFFTSLSLLTENEMYSKNGENANMSAHPEHMDFNRI